MSAPFANATACSARNVSPSVATKGKPRSSLTTTPMRMAPAMASSPAARSSSTNVWKAAAWDWSTRISPKEGTSCSASILGRTSISDSSIDESEPADRSACTSARRARERPFAALVFFAFCFATEAPIARGIHTSNKPLILADSTSVSIANALGAHQCPSIKNGRPAFRARGDLHMWSRWR